MQFFMDVWNDAIALRWDGTAPKGTSDAQYVAFFKSEFYTTATERTASELVATRRIPIDAPGVLLRDKLADPNSLLESLPRLKGHARWNEKQRCFLLSLSRQNLRRIYEQLGQIHVATGQQRIERLKAAYAAFQDDVRKAVVCKTRAELPAYQYKVPPLGEYQHRGVVYLTNVKPAALFGDCGIGKTFQVLTSTEQQIRYGLIRPGETLVCAKLATLRHGWAEDAAKYTSLKVVTLWAKPGKKRKQRLLELLAEPADVYAINHEGVRVLEAALREKRFRKVVVDESTVLKSFRGMRATKTGAFGRSLMRVAAEAEYRVIMSGTPTPNDADDAMGQLLFLDPQGFLLERTWRDFQAAHMKEVHFGDKDNPDTPSKFVMTVAGRQAVAAALAPLMYRVRLRDVIQDLPPRATMVRSLPMSDEQLKHYEEMEEYLQTIIDDTAVTVTMRLSLIGKLRQITGGWLIDKDEQAHPIADNPKLAMLESMLTDEIAADEKVVVFAQYRHEIEEIERRFGAVSVYGGNSSTKNLESIDRFLKDAGTRIIVLHPRSAMHGLTLTVARYLIFYSFSYSSEEAYQSVRRIERASQTREMCVYYLSTEDSIDEIELEVVRAKEQNQSAILDGGEFVDEADSAWRGLSRQLKTKKSQRKRKRIARSAGKLDVATAAPAP